MFAPSKTRAFGSIPTAGQVQDSLNSIPALAGNVSVAGNAGGPFTVNISHLGAVTLDSTSGATLGELVE